MSLNIESYDVLLLMIPGMIAFGYLDIWVLGQKAKKRQWLAYSIILGSFCYFLENMVSYLVCGNNVFSSIDAEHILIPRNAGHFYFSCFIGVAVGVCLRHCSVFRRFHVGEQIVDLFGQNKRVRVHVPIGKKKEYVYEGLLLSVADGKPQSGFFLKNVKIKDDKGVEIYLDGVYITEDMQGGHIEIMKEEDSI